MILSPHLVLITGATRGLGKLVADKFWTDGNNLVLIARNEKELQKVADEYLTTGHPNQHVYYFPTDLTNLDAIPSLINSIKINVGNPDIIINNAAMQGPIGPIYLNDWQEWQNCLNVCLLAPVQICREFMPAMIGKRFGRIINISGGGATRPRQNFSSYATAKCGLVRFSETIAQEVEQYGITVNCVAPGAMRSNMTEKIINAGMKSAGSAELECALQLMQTNPHTEERAAELVHFLTTDECSSLNGKLISTVWDPWEKLPDFVQNLKQNDVYTLRRIIPEDRNFSLE